MSFIIITKNRCDWCTKTKSLLDESGLEYEEVNIDDSLYMKTILSMAKVATVPQVFRPDGELIGGYEHVKVYLGRH